MNQEKLEILIDGYLSGELKGTELIDFERQLKENSTLKEQVQFQQEVMASLKDTGKMRLRQTLNEIHTENTQHKTISIYSWRIQTIAATLLVAILLGSVLIMNDVTNISSNQVLFEEYFSPESALLTVRSGDEAIELTAIDRGMNFYVQESYNKAIESFQLDASNMLGRLYTGFSYMHLEQYKLAEMQFEFILTNNNNLFLDQAEWNLGLCYLVSGETLLATEAFSTISKGSTVYNKRALQLLTEMGETN